MDVSNILASHAAKFQSVTVEKETPLDVDTGFLTVTDLTPIDEDSYKSNLEEYLQMTARDGIQALVATLYGLPTQPSPDGPLAQLPPPTTQLPRTKPLPKPKPPTKWERFAAAKGIQKRVREKKVWDEERQEWVNRWGKDGKNKEKEEQWIHEVKADAPVDHDPVKAARDARTSRVAKNERQRLQNISRAQTSSTDREERKTDIERTLATTRISTASMGRFDKKLDGEKKLRGVKRKFEATETSVEQEKQASLAVLSKLDGDVKIARKEKGAGDDVLNVRKAIRNVSKGKGGVALAREANKKGARGKRGGKR
ncbi:ribosome biogenesis regulatory protein-domain-containing protein [Suillus bovinus]|uniref:ribosome biogenesis regulatory protein-domain-containing protein n=1 Tax=Suillus bovinus TaxID=48563 RepID=UPI001B867C5E|nr:ribosome biogenesis regulatory protein-domain-containing protein [Suillus bovinus]KAG2135750.1 ribosome biogenesis regulatory protein-domain-containing protein [Suillus bovinus]